MLCPVDTVLAVGDHLTAPHGVGCRHVRVHTLQRDSINNQAGVAAYFQDRYLVQDIYIVAVCRQSRRIGSQ